MILKNKIFLTYLDKDYSTIQSGQSVECTERSQPVSMIAIVFLPFLQHPCHQNVFAPLPSYLKNKLRNRLSSDIVNSIIFVLNKNSIPQDIKKAATESDFANVIGM